MGSFAKRLGRGVARLLVTAAALGLLGLVFVLLSEFNAQSFFLDLRDGQLLVMRGRLFPVGRVPFQPHDPFLREAYGPVQVDQPPASDLLGTRYKDREALDRALFNVLASEAAIRVTSDDPATLDKGLYYLHRAEILTGVSSEQRQTLEHLKLEVAFYEARQKLDQARRTLNEGLSQLRQASSTPNRHARPASQMLLEVEPSAKALEVSLQRAVHQISEPAPVPPEPSHPPAVHDAGTP